MMQSLLLKFIDFLGIFLLLINFNLYGIKTTITLVETDDEIKNTISKIKEMYDDGLKFYNNGNYKNAIRNLEDSVVCIEGKELVDKMKQEYESAKEYIGKSQEKLDNLINNYISKAKQSKKLAEQIKELKLALTIDSESTEIKKLLKELEPKVVAEVGNLYFKGVDLYATDKLEEAIKIWKEALELKPDHTRIKKDLARAESKLKLLNK